MLSRAQIVHVMQFYGDALRDEGGLSNDLSSVAEWLQRHGVTASIQVETTGTAVGDAPLSRAADQGRT